MSKYHTLNECETAPSKHISTLKSYNFHQVHLILTGSNMKTTELEEYIIIVPLLTMKMVSLREWCHLFRGKCISIVPFPCI